MCLAMSHDASCMSCMQNPTKGFSEIITWVNNAKTRTTPMAFVPASAKRKVHLGSQPVARTPALLWCGFDFRLKWKSELCSVYSKMVNSLRGLSFVREKAVRLSCVARVCQQGCSFPCKSCQEMPCPLWWSSCCGAHELAVHFYSEPLVTSS